MNKDQEGLCAVCGETLDGYAMHWHDQEVCENCENTKTEQEIETILLTNLEN